MFVLSENYDILGQRYSDIYLIYWNTLFSRLAEIIEIETENYMKMDPDPFDERHPSRIDPECKLGQILKALFKKDNFMNKVIIIFHFKIFLSL